MIGCRVTALAVACSLWAAPAGADEALIFRWVDKAGNLHVTDRLGDVPEPYYGAYLAELKRREALRAQQGAAVAAPAPAVVPEVEPPADPPAAQPSLVDQEIARREHWRQTVAFWRDELRAATEALVAVEAERAQAALNPLLAQTPQVQATVAALDARRAEALERVGRARQVLLEELPQRARRENVPPKWLE